MLSRKLLLVFLVLLGELVAPAVASSPADEARAFVANLARGNMAAAAARFTPEMTEAMSEAGLAKLWRDLGEKMGAFQIIEDIQKQSVKGFHCEMVVCVFSRGKVGVRLTMTAENRVSGLYLVDPSVASASSTYVDMNKFVERTVAVGTYALDGALDLPVGPLQFPGLVLVSGTGPNDMDETIEGIKPFRDLAQGLASRGVAVVRFEKRTHKGIAVRTVMDEYIEDTNAAVALLASTPGVGRVFVLGHSMGGTLAPRIAQANPKVAGIAILAGTGASFARLIVTQLEYQKKLGFGGAKMDALIASARESAKQIDDPALKPDDEVTLFGQKIPGSYFLDLRTYKAIDVTAALTIPVFIGWGTRDLKCIPEDFETWHTALAKRPNVIIRTYDELQHLFTRVGKAQGAHVEPVVVDDIAKWLGR